MRIEKLRMRVRTVSAIILGVMLVALTCITVLDVVGRYLFNAPLSGGTELTELLVMGVIFAGLPAISLDDGHVTADLLSQNLSRRGRTIQLFLARLCAVIALSLVTMEMWKHGARLSSYNQTTVFLHIPVGLMVQAAAAICGLSTLIVAVLALTRAPHGN
ncbi:MAG TPA: TRAP transporter small permease [Paracoccus sp. (in: a-proteobacteria)]|uniref:TRAP transporter small permease n=1 Tax=uncultured Paracoccus sp. TaxID=189685 RepID=UPI002604807A|nr:TRAP transporter small permease [uncultured Paracoccus sp.]HMQ39939.1 TRAP transporter small permease [Paracoccus sp. (in: a-proteobacteria)]HMR35550.1 TRAP transporter small permease [Paracoccus sp. (in: a-proteobacteria)]